MKIYIYPTYTPNRDKSGNLYIKYFHEAFNKDSNYSVVNRFWEIGITSLLFNIDADIFIIQWVDLIPFKRLGKMQFAVFLSIIGLIHLLKNKQIVWIMHNKRAHNGDSKLVDFGMKFIAKYANVVITHSSDGVDFFNSHFSQFRGKCYYLPHPVYTSELFDTTTIEWDYIIWGGISPRKRVAEFLQYAKNEKFFRNKKILVCGRCSDINYDNKIKGLLWPDVTYDNRFISDVELRQLISKSRCILFTYNTDSLLSSGALIYSLNFCKPIIGPRSGNFLDLNGIVSCYNEFKDIPKLQIHFGKKNVREYLTDNTWETFPLKLLKKTKCIS